MEEQRNGKVKLAKERCRCVIDRVQRLPDTTNVTDSCRRTLLKLAQSELAFLSRRSSFTTSTSTPLCVNIGHLEAVVHILQQPFITGVSRVCKSIPLLSSVTSEDTQGSSLKDIHVDIVCNLNRKPVWIIVSDRNPKYISWYRCHRSNGLKWRIQRLLVAARSTLTLRPSSVILFFANGLAHHVQKKLQDEFGASEFRLEFSIFNSDTFEESESDWTNVLSRSYRDACAFEIKLAGSNDAISSSECDTNGINVDTPQPELLVEKSETRSHNSEDSAENNLGDAFCSVVLGMKLCSLDIENLESAEPRIFLGEGDLVNFDTTALIALVSGISNGGTSKLLATPDSELKQRFKGNSEFVIGQVMSEIQKPIHVEFSRVLCGKKGVICKCVQTEFKELILMCGGPNEKLRADKLINCLWVVPDSPSERMMGLPTTRKLALKNKIVFGTGDYWHAPTLTANVAFVRAVSQTGMSLSTIEHRPRALIGD